MRLLLFLLLVINKQQTTVEMDVQSGAAPQIDVLVSAVHPTTGKYTSLTTVSNRVPVDALKSSKKAQVVCLCTTTTEPRMHIGTCRITLALIRPLANSPRPPTVCERACRGSLSSDAIVQVPTVVEPESDTSPVDLDRRSNVASNLSLARRSPKTATPSTTTAQTPLPTHNRPETSLLIPTVPADDARSLAPSMAESAAPSMSPSVLEALQAAAASPATAHEPVTTTRYSTPGKPDDEINIMSVSEKPRRAYPWFYDASSTPETAQWLLSAIVHSAGELPSLLSGEVKHRL